MKINFKQGLRRIVLSLISCITLGMFSFYVFNGFLFDNNKFIDNVFVFSNSTNKEIELKEFAKHYLTNDKLVWTSDFKCFPYKGYCILEKNNNKIEIYGNKEQEMPILNLSLYSDKQLIELKQGKGDLIKQKLYIKMPSPLKYFSWQMFDLFLIFIISLAIYGFYLILEFVFCWIIRGFKE